MKLCEIKPEIGVIDMERPAIKTQQPPMFHVMLNNDDYVSGTAVSGALQEVFKMDNQRALQIMLHAHRTGKAVVATFSRDVAETKATQAAGWVEKFHAQQGVEGGVSQYLFTVEPAE